jgi:hypothetical protein
MKSMEIKNHRDVGSVLVEGNHEGDDEDFLFKHKYRKI